LSDEIFVESGNTVFGSVDVGGGIKCAIGEDVV
jgi:hypothetical protein